MPEQEEEKVEIKRLANREMADQSIAKTFRGILRVANIVDCENQEDDKFFNGTLYGVPTGGLSGENKGSDSAYAALAGGTVRYTYKGDAYKNKSVPVTDSMGNYLNFNLSTNSVTFGSDELNNGSSVVPVKFTQPNGTTFQHDKVFPVLKSGKIFIGYEKIELAENKDFITNGSITVEASPASTDEEPIEPMVIINNNYNHTEKNNDGKNYKALDSVNLVGSYEDLIKANSTGKLAKNYRTIIKIRNHTPSAYDGLVHFQDDIDNENFDFSKFKDEGKKVIETHDAFVDAIDIKDYIKNKVFQYMESNMVEVPPGMIIAQYVNLRKWYGIDEETEIGLWKGNQPPMGQVQKTDLYAPTMEQGTVKKGYNQLVAYAQSQTNTDEFYVPDTEVNDPMQYGKVNTPKKLKEIIPLYKRDYAICNGDTFTIYVMTPDMVKMEHYSSYKQFMDLFFAIGYQYTDYSKIRSHYVNEPAPGRTDGVYRLKGYSPCTPDSKPPRAVGLVGSNACQDKDILFGIDLVTIQAAVALYTEIQAGGECMDENGQYSRDLAEEWLKKQPFPVQYIFNTPIEEGGFKYKYFDNRDLFSDETLNDEENSQKMNDPTFNLGWEVNSFSSKICYYDHQKKAKVACEVWKTGEVQMAIDLFTWNGRYRDEDLKNYFTFPFQIPNMDQHVEGQYDTGAFVGSSPNTWTDENKYSSSFPSESHHTFNTYPHRHIIFWGPKEFMNTPWWGQPNEEEAKKTVVPRENLTDKDGEATNGIYPTMVRASGIEDATLNWANWNGTFTGYVAEKHGCRNAYNAKDFINEKNCNSYDIAEMRDFIYRKEGVDGGPATYVIQWELNEGKGTKVTKKNHPDPRWRNAEPNRGTTSPPINNDEIYNKFDAAGKDKETSSSKPSTDESTGGDNSSSGSDDWKDKYPPGTEIPDLPETTIPDTDGGGEGSTPEDGEGEENGGSEESGGDTPSTDTESGNSGGTVQKNINWFNPENVQLVYLIKL